MTDGLPDAQHGKRYDSFVEFYDFYLDQHKNRTSRRLHFLGSTLALICVLVLIITRNPLWILAALVFGYGPAWIGHFFFERNKPAAFRQPIFSFMGDWKMYWETLTGRIPW